MKFNTQSNLVEVQNQTRTYWRGSERFILGEMAGSKRHTWLVDTRRMERA